MDFGVSSQIESLASLSRRQIAQAGERLVWRHYAPGQLILPHQVKIDLNGLVYHGKVQVIAVTETHRRVAGYVQTGELLQLSKWTHSSTSVEFRAADFTLICFVPGDSQRAESSQAHRQPHFRLRLQWRLFGALLILAIVISASAPDWLPPARSLISEVVYGLASLSLGANDYQSAKSMLEAGASINPQSAWAYNDLGFLYTHEGRLSEAREVFRRAVATDATFAVAQNNLGLNYLEAGQVDPARAALRQAVVLNPESAVGWLNLGVAEQQANDQEAAARAYRAALRLDPHLTLAQFNLGTIYFEQGRFSEAKPYLESALSTGPDAPQAQLMLGAIAINEQDYAGARNYLEAAAARLPNDPSLYFYRALWYEKQGLIENARQELDRLLALHPPPELLELAQSHRRLLTQP